MYNDITYCVNIDCPFKNCEKHHTKLKGKIGAVSIADFGGTCREYMSYLVEMIDNDKFDK